MSEFNDDDIEEDKEEKQEEKEKQDEEKREEEEEEDDISYEEREYFIRKKYKKVRVKRNNNNNNNVDSDDDDDYEYDDSVDVIRLVASVEEIEKINQIEEFIKLFPYAGTTEINIIKNVLIPMTNKIVIFFKGSKDIYEYDEVTNSMSIIGNHDLMHYSAITLKNGNIALFGGEYMDGKRWLHFYPSGCVLFDVKGRKFYEFGKLVKKRWGSFAVLLNDNRVLIIGGQVSKIGGDYDENEDYTRVCELFDLTTGFSTFSKSRLRIGRIFASASLLQDGRVIITGGTDSRNQFLSETEIYDPITDTFSDGPSMVVKRYSHSATLLQDGNVLLCGGYSRSESERMMKFSTQTEIYDHKENRFVEGPSKIYESKSDFTKLIRDGRVLIFEDVFLPNVDNEFNITPAIEYYDPVTKKFTLHKEIHPQIDNE
jgi:hypothetical protein